MRTIVRGLLPGILAALMLTTGCNKGGSADPNAASGDSNKPAEANAAAPADSNAAKPAEANAAAPADSNAKPAEANAAAPADSNAAAAAPADANAPAGDANEQAAAEPAAATEGPADPKAPDPEPKPDEVAAAGAGQDGGVVLPEPKPVEEKPEAIDPETGKPTEGKDAKEMDPVNDPKVKAELGDTGAPATGFEAALTPHGTWITDGENGKVWHPKPEQVGAMDFMPYTRGKWEVTGAGYYFKSEFPEWGFAADHFGGWYKSEKSPVGWLWAPDKDYAPARVMWRRGDARIGWAPLPPKYNFETPQAVPADWFVFVKARNFLNANIYKFTETSGVRLYWYNRLPMLTALRYYNGLPYYNGPRWSWVRLYYPTYRPVRFRTLFAYYPYRRWLTRRVYLRPRAFVIRPFVRVRLVGGRLAPARVVIRPSIRIGGAVRVGGVGGRVTVGGRVGGGAVVGAKGHPAGHKGPAGKVAPPPKAVKAPPAKAPPKAAPAAKAPPKAAPPKAAPPKAAPPKAAPPKAAPAKPKPKR